MLAGTNANLSAFNFSIRCSLLLLTACVLPLATVQADVIDWSVGRFQYAEQTADNTAPGPPNDFEVFGQLATDDSSDFSSAVLNGPGGIRIPFTDTNGQGDWEFFQSFGTEAAMLNAFPDGTYKIDASGPLGTFSESVEFNSAFPAAPVFTGSVFSDLQGMDPTLDFNSAGPHLRLAGGFCSGKKLGDQRSFLRMASTMGFRHRPALRFSAEH